MAEKPKRHLDPELAKARRAQVINAASECFRRKGYHGASMAELAKTAGMSAGHIYNYFENKEAIIEAIIERDKAEMFSAFDGFIQQQGELLDIMLSGVDQGVDKHLNTDRAALELEMLSEGARNEKVALLLQQSDIHCRALIRQLMKSERSKIKHLPEDEIEGRVNVLCSMFSGLMVRQLLEPGLKRDPVIAALKITVKALLLP